MKYYRSIPFLLYFIVIAEARIYRQRAADDVDGRGTTHFHQSEDDGIFDDFDGISTKFHTDQTTPTTEAPPIPIGTDQTETPSWEEIITTTAAPFDPVAVADNFENLPVTAAPFQPPQPPASPPDPVPQAPQIPEPQTAPYAVVPQPSSYRAQPNAYRASYRRPVYYQPTYQYRPAYRPQPQYQPQRPVYYAQPQASAASDDLVYLTASGPVPVNPALGPIILYGNSGNSGTSGGGGSAIGGFGQSTPMYSGYGSGYGAGYGSQTYSTQATAYGYGSGGGYAQDYGRWSPYGTTYKIGQDSLGYLG
ncbi:unnamed protein product, partial [Mesorhabditis spiculigera]